MVGDHGGRGDGRADPVNPMRLFWELSARLPDERDRHRRLRLVSQLVRAAACVSAAIRGSLSGTLATMGPGVPYAIGAKFAQPGPAGHRARRRRGDADERPGRAAHREAVRRALVRPAADRRGPAQQRPQPGHLGDAGDGRRAEVRASRRCCRTSSYADFARGLGLLRDHGDGAGRAGAGLGGRPWRRTARRCSTCTATPRCRRSRRTRHSSRSRTLPSLSRRATRTVGTSCVRDSGRRCRRHSGPAVPVRKLTDELPTDAPEADGTLAWSSTTAVVVTSTATPLAVSAGLRRSCADVVTTVRRRVAAADAIRAAPGSDGVGSSQLRPAGACRIRLSL